MKSFLDSVQLNELRLCLERIAERLHDDPSLSPYRDFEMQLHNHTSLINRLIDEKNPFTEKPDATLYFIRKSGNRFNSYPPEWIPYYRVDGTAGSGQEKYFEITKSEALSGKYDQERSPTSANDVLGKWFDGYRKQSQSAQAAVEAAEQRLEEAKRHLRTVTTKARPEINVTDHAVVRYLQHVVGVDIDSIRDMVANKEFYGNLMALDKLEPSTEIKASTHRVRVSRSGEIVTVLPLHDDCEKTTDKVAEGAEA